MDIENSKGIIEDEADAGGTDDGTQDKKTPTDLNAEPEPGNEPDLNGGTEDGADGEQADGVEEEGGVEEQNAEPDINAKLTELKDGILKTLEEKIRPEEKPREITEQQWIEHEKEWGVGRQTIDRITRQSVKVFENMKQYVDEKFAGLEKDARISSLKSEFPDIQRLKPGIDEFLKGFDPKHHSNPELLKRAAIYARGLNASKDMHRLRSNGQKNLKVISKIRPGAGENGKAAPGKTTSLTAQQREAAALMPGGEAEYRRILSRKDNVIAV